MKKVSRANTYFLIILLIQLVLPIHLIFQWFDIKDTRIILITSHIIMFIIPAIIYLMVTKQSAKDVLRLNKLHFKDGMLIILLSFICQPIMTFFSILSQFFFDNEIANFMIEIINTPYILLLLIVAVLPAITEEITIRGVVLSGYDNKNIYLSCIITGLFFGIMHLDPQQFLYATVLGFILAIIVRITNTIFASALMHFFINGTSITLQKIISLFPQNNEIMEQAEEITLKSMTVMEKSLILGVYGIIAIAFAVAAYFIIKKLADINIRRGTITRDDMKITDNKDNEKVFNFQFILIIIVYISVMFVSISLR